MSTFTLSFMEEKTSHIILSVIVPVYNVERFLPRCLDSLLRQGMQSGEWEIICVDDGSTDGSPAILADYARRNPELIRVITQKNQGLGPARNTGMAVAQGEYITFVDSDDYVIDGAYRYVCEHCLEGKPDMVHCNHRLVFTDGKMVADPDAKPDGEILSVTNGVDDYNRSPYYAVWKNLYRREFLEKHHILSENVVAQDALFNFLVFQQHPRLYNTSCDLYRYEQGNKDSILTTVRKERVLVQLDQWLFHNIGIMEKYLQEGDGELAPGVRINIHNWLDLSHKKLLYAFLSWKDWKKYSRRMRSLSPYRIPSNNMVEKVVAGLKSLSVWSYLLYFVVCFLRHHVFLRFIRPRIVKDDVHS